MEKYEDLEIEVIEFESTDIITDSDPTQFPEVGMETTKDSPNTSFRA